MDRGTARNFVSLKAEDPDQTVNTPAQYNSAIDLAEEQFAIDTRAVFKNATLTVVDATSSQADTPSDLLACILVRHKGLKLKPTNVYDLSFQMGEDWRDITGTPTHFYIDEENEKIVLVPEPTSDDAGANLDVFYAAIPANVSDDATVLLNAKTLLAIYHPAIVSWAASWVLGYRPWTPQIEAKKAGLLKDYERYRDQCIETYKNMQDEPLQMKGGRNWQDRAAGGSTNAFSDN